MEATPRNMGKFLLVLSNVRENKTTATRLLLDEVLFDFRLPYAGRQSIIRLASGEIAYISWRAYALGADEEFKPDGIVRISNGTQGPIEIVPLQLTPTGKVCLSKAPFAHLSHQMD